MDGKQNEQEEMILITVEQAAKKMSLGRTTVYDLIAREGLPVHRFKSAVRVDPVELRAWLKERRPVA